MHSTPPTPSTSWAKVAPLAALALCALTGAPQAGAQTAETQVQHESRLMLHYYGRGYARALLDASLPAAQLDLKSDKPRPVTFASGDLALTGTAKARDLTVTRLTLNRGDFADLGLQIGQTPVEALLREFGSPERQDTRRLVYRGISEICVDHMVFRLSRGVLQGIEWDWCAD